MYDMQTKQEPKYCYIALSHSQKTLKGTFQGSQQTKGPRGRFKATDSAAVFGVLGVRICYLQLSEEEEDKKPNLVI